MEDQLMIKVDNISKEYRMGQIGGTTLRDELQRFSARLHQREDPTRRIGEKDNKSNERFLALDNVSFEVKKGERIGIIGRNGAGKSTLLKLISRVTAPTSGMIGLNGRVASMLEVGTGFHGELTGRENIYMNGAILGMTRREINAKLEDIIEFSECRQFIDTPVKRYSSGMYVKLAFSVAAHLDSEIMIMDEVLAVGDLSFQRKCLDKMNELSRAEEKTILYVSHQMDTIRKLCNRCIVLEKGKICFQGDVSDSIGYYMNTGEMMFEKEIDATLKEHHTGNTDNVVLVHISVMGDKNTFCSSDQMCLKLIVQSKKSFEDVRFMFILFYVDGTRIAKTESSNFQTHPGMNEIEVEVPCEGLADGMYYYEISILRRNNKGLREKCDCVPNAMSFTVYNSKIYGLTAEKWRMEYWGHFMLQQIKVNSVAYKI